MAKLRGNSLASTGNFAKIGADEDMKRQPAKRSAIGPCGNKDRNRYPDGWNRKRVGDVIAFYDRQSDGDAISEADTAYGKRTSALIEVPLKLLPKVRRILALR